MSSAILTWPEAVAAGPAVCGGKGFNLARLVRYGFSVPNGGVLAADAYRLAMLDEGTKRAIQGGHDAELPDSVRADLRRFLEANDLIDLPLAVRSSATAEDSERASFAGIHRSFLNVRGIEAIERAVVACYSSLWTPHARAYRARMGFDEGACAVVICRMVTSDASDEPRCAGVAFSADPRSGRRDVLTIDAVAGTGEGAVSGRVNPQRFIFQIVHGRPALRTSPAVDPLLSPRELEELACTVQRIHWALGDGQDPQDVEWAHDGSRLWILQARPITALPRGGPAGLQRLPQYWSRGNVKDSVPGVPCELSWSGLHELVNAVAFAGPHVSGYREVHGLELVRRFDGRVYFDFTLLQWTFFDAFGVAPEVSVRSVGGHQPTMEAPPGDPLKGPEGRRRRLASLRLLRSLWAFEKKQTPRFRRHIEEMRALACEPFASMSKAELTRVFSSIDSKQHGLAIAAGLANSAYGRWFIPLEQMLTRSFGPRGRALTAALSSGSDAITSAEQGYRVGDLARLAQADPVAFDWLHSTTDPHSWTALPSNSPFRLALQRFLDEFGHRATRETDATVPRWAEDPSTLLTLVREHLVSPTATDPRARGRERYARADAEIRASRPLLAPMVRWVARRLRRAYAARELGKSALVAAMLPMRRLVLEIGRRLTDEGHLAAPEQVFDLTATDLRAWLDGWWDARGAGDLAADRHARREVWLRNDPPDVIPGAGAMLPPGPPIAHSPTDDVWRGIAASSGRATGVARVVLHPEDGSRLAHGDILAASSTDPGWTPLFVRAAAIVMETGGYLSHGAIVAREYGLPAVVNIPGLLQQVKDGDTLDVDGDEGTVRIIDRPR